MTKKQPTYKDALIEIESIVDKIENGNPDVDQLGAMITRAVSLVKICKKNIRKTDTEINKALKELEE
ncbi:MAG: exodeoxyribonuclease VII small subunit [Cyclobacteriaceae bacterium]|nr:exodeoxyribonuclease VII small subunit [Cyclobacteriaceae bacterium]